MGRVSQEVRERYNAKVYDRVGLRLRKNTSTSKDAVLAAADKLGETLNGYITNAVRERMERDELGVITLYPQERIAAQIREAAAKAGQSIEGYVINAVLCHIEREQDKQRATDNHPRGNADTTDKQG